MDNTLAKLIRASRGPVLLMTLGVLLALQQFSGVTFDRTFPVLIIMFGVMWLMERMVPRRAGDAVVNVQSIPMTPMPPLTQPIGPQPDPLAYDPLRDVHQKVYGGDVPPPMPRQAAPAPVKADRILDPNEELPTAEHPIRQQQQNGEGKP